ncbi:antitoxin Xre/MbcA/ParS toxin-binding domain-containing protein [Croceibacterium ferulae]|uniref:antitoxin Xre/MbcA/ParS toxin-binding domain-containing protein n=1 Tax=Croceibacterium ferulae TaxID=1854641 RepID=UPI000EACAB50|nr:antitoxin Xre/MbcA/ParS toxin-binding domain-containing protein [Croceibacterium ferulae]
MSEPSETLDSPAAAAPRRGPVRFRRADAPRLGADDARRQGDITRLAFQRLGREGAISFLNTDNAELGTRPLDLATSSATGFASVEAAIGRLSATPSGEV